jgi:hypothetical protein
VRDHPDSAPRRAQAEFFGGGDTDHPVKNFWAIGRGAESAFSVNIKYFAKLK